MITMLDLSKSKNSLRHFDHQREKINTLLRHDIVPLRFWNLIYRWIFFFFYVKVPLVYLLPEAAEAAVITKSSSNFVTLHEHCWSQNVFLKAIKIFFEGHHRFSLMHISGGVCGECFQEDVHECPPGNQGPQCIRLLAKADTRWLKTQWTYTKYKS